MEIISRQEALKQGLKRYFTGKPCKNGHVAERFASIRGCVECCRAFGAAHFSKRYSTDPEFVSARNQKSREWFARNPEKSSARQRKWRSQNPEKNRQYCAAWQKNNPEKMKESARKARAKHREKIAETIKRWKERNPERVRMLNQVHKHVRRTREKITGGTFTVADIEALYVKQNSTCAVCPCTENLEIDHIHPIVLGGSSDPSNLQLLCRPCNRNKGGKHPDAWRKELATKQQSPY